MSVIMLKKLGAKQICGDLQKLCKKYCANEGDKISLYTIFGVTTSIKSGTSTYGVWYSFQGQFEATNYIDGLSYASNQAFIPEPVCSLLLKALEGSDNVQFAVTVDMKRRDDVAQGYEFIVTPHTQTAENDALAHLRGLVPQLPAPVEVVPPVEKVEETKPTPAAPSKGNAKK